MSTPGSFRLLLAGAMLLGCARSPVVKAVADYRSEALRGKSVVFTRLAVTDDLGDARTGIILSGRTRSAAAREACAAVADAWSDGRIVCLSARDGESNPEFQELERLFAEGRPIPKRLWETVRAKSRADFVVLFRPETVDASQELSQGKLDQNFLGSNDTAIPTSTIVSGVHAAPIQTINETELSYTISATLVDLASGKPLKSGVHSGSASRTVKHNAGFAMAPPAQPLLAEIMTELGEALLED